MTEPLTQAEITDYCERVLEIVNHASEATNLRDYLESTKAEPIGFDPLRDGARAARMEPKTLARRPMRLNSSASRSMERTAEQQKEKN